MDIIIFFLGVVYLFRSVKNNNVPMLAIAVVLFFMALSPFLLQEKKEQPADDLPKPPNYDKESLLELMEKGECMGGTIDEGKFSVFVCKN